MKIPSNKRFQLETKFDFKWYAIIETQVNSMRHFELTWSEFLFSLTLSFSLLTHYWDDMSRVLSYAQTYLNDTLKYWDRRNVMSMRYKNALHYYVFLCLLLGATFFRWCPFFSCLISKWLTNCRKMHVIEKK